MSEGEGRRAGSGRQGHRPQRADFRHYFAGETQGQGLLKFRTHAKRATLWLGTILWLLTIPISAYEGYRILQVGLAAAATVEIVAVTAGILVAGGVLIAIGTGEGLWKEVLHNFWRYFLLLIVAPCLLLAAWYLHTQGMESWRDAAGAVALLLVASSFFIGSKPPPDDVDIETALDEVFEADVRRHVERLLADLRGGDVRVPEKLGGDEKSRLLRRFPQESELGGRPFMAQPALDDRPRITPQGFLVLLFGEGALVSCEGAIDLTTGELTGYCLREIDYRDIGPSSLEATGAAYVEPPAGTVRARQRRLQMPAMAVARPPPSYRTAFAIGLPGNARIEVVVRDGAALGSARTFGAVADGHVAPLTGLADVRRTWEMLAAAKRRSAAPG
jgi:hypothetical protein